MVQDNPRLIILLQILIISKSLLWADFRSFTLLETQKMFAYLIIITAGVLKGIQEGSMSFVICFLKEKVSEYNLCLRY